MFKEGRKNLAILCLVSGASMAVSLPAVADSNWYAGVGIGKAEADVSDSSVSQRLLGAAATGITSSVDDGDTAYKVTVGYNYNKYFSVEGGYINFGNFDIDASGSDLGQPIVGSFDADTDGFSIAAVGKWPIANQFSLIGKVGAYYWNSDVDVNVVQSGVPVATASVDDDGTDFFYGVGAQYDFNKFSVRAEYEIYNDIIEEDYKVYTLNLLYRF